MSILPWWQADQQVGDWEMDTDIVHRLPLTMVERKSARHHGSR